MKFVSDSEQVFPHSTIGLKPDSKHFYYHENGLDSTGLKSENSIVKEYHSDGYHEDGLDSTGLKSENIIAKEYHRDSYHENGLDSTRLKSENRIVKEYHTDTLCASKANEGVADHLPHVTNDADGLTARKLHRSTSLNELAKDNEKDVRELEASVSHSCGEMKSFENLGFYMDKSVTECGLPEFIVCYKESTYHVKDICIDEGVHFRDRILFEGNVDKKGVSAFFFPEEDGNGELMEETKDSDMPVPDVLKSSAENDSDEDIANRCDSSEESDFDEDIVDLCDSKDLMLAGNGNDDVTDEITNDACKKFSRRDFPSMHNMGAENSHSNSSKDNELESEKESFQFQGSCGKASLANPALARPAEESNGGTDEAVSRGSDLVSASEESHNGGGEVILANPALVSATEKAHDNGGEASLASTDLVSASDESTKISTADSLSYKSMMETGSITFDFDASASRARSKEEHLQIGDSQHIETPGMYKFEDAPRQSVSSQVHIGLGESSFSAAGSLPGLISYSGPAYSGSVSLRSDSSTASTRSFAFPILQSEWNSSPVRMAKADRRHYRKHKWSQCLLCSRF